MARRKQDEPQAFPGLTAMDGVPFEDDNPEAAYVYLTDSTETNKVRTPGSVGDNIQIRCVFTNRALTRDEERAFRNDEPLPDGIVVSPAQVDCTVTAPGVVLTYPNTSQREDGIYVSGIVVGRVGGWAYRFVGRGGWSGLGDRAFDIT